MTAIKNKNISVNWCCNPCSSSKSFKDVLNNIKVFFKIFKQLKSVPNGLFFITEQSIRIESDVGFELNHQQVMEIIMFISVLY